MITYTVTVNGVDYTVDSIERNNTSLSFRVDGAPHTVTVRYTPPSQSNSSSMGSSIPSAIQATSIPSGNPTPQTPGEVRAPMPGIVSTVSVSLGDKVGVGDTVMVIEAMKMENPIRASSSGVVSEIAVSLGQEVQTGALLLRIRSEE